MNAHEWKGMEFRVEIGYLHSLWDKHLQTQRESMLSLVPVAHTYNPSYSGGRDQEDHGSQPAQANSWWDPILKNPSQKRAGWVAYGVGPEFKPQYCKKKRKNRGRLCFFLIQSQVTLFFPPKGLEKKE
jgi:hypothetical protein